MCKCVLLPQVTWGFLTCTEKWNTFLTVQGVWDNFCKRPLLEHNWCKDVSCLSLLLSTNSWLYNILMWNKWIVFFLSCSERLSVDSEMWARGQWFPDPAETVPAALCPHLHPPAADQHGQQLCWGCGNNLGLVTGSEGALQNPEGTWHRMWERNKSSCSILCYRNLGTDWAHWEISVTAGPLHSWPVGGWKCCWALNSFWESELEASLWGPTIQESSGRNS